MNRYLLAALLALAVLMRTAACAAPAVPATTVAAIRPDPLPLKLPAPKAGHARPLVAVLADNKGSETTDFIIPYGVLKDSGAAEVVSVSTRPGPVKLMMVLSVQADTTLAAFDQAHPEGADIVVVPAMMDGKDPAMLAWLAAQYDRGAVVVAICEGARVVARTGILDGHAATSHWSALKGLAKAHPNVHWARDLRYVQSGRLITTTGVTASLPVSVALVEAIAGREAAQAEAARLGLADWGPVHRTADFELTGGDYASAIGGIVSVWDRKRVEAPLSDGVDEIALALRADAWSRTFRDTVVSTSAGGAPVRSRHGLVFLPDSRPRKGAVLLAMTDRPAALALDEALAEIGRTRGEKARRLAALGLEYPQR